MKLRRAFLFIQEHSAPRHTHDAQISRRRPTPTPRPEERNGETGFVRADRKRVTVPKRGNPPRGPPKPGYRKTGGDPGTGGDRVRGVRYGTKDRNRKPGTPENPGTPEKTGNRNPPETLNPRKVGSGTGDRLPGVYLPRYPLYP
uniref:Putative secreted protein n=1 Tax=Ixodes ricinus TaxID=34613 RepID=A0A0K8RHS4_IXORI